MPLPSLVKVRLEYLQIDVGNPRYDPKGSQIEALTQISHDQGLKLFNLAEDIVEKGINHSDLPIIAPSGEKDSYTVLEGNRRVAALKLLTSPDLLASVCLPPNLHKKYTALVNRGEGNLPTELQCVVLSREDANYWIQLKHTGENEGVGIVSWNGRAKHRFRGFSPALQAIERVEASNLLDAETRAHLPKIAITNIERILVTPDARLLLGVEVKNGKLSINTPENEGLGRLALIVSDVAHRRIRVSDLDSKEQRIAYARATAGKPLPIPSAKTAGRSATGSRPPVTASRYPADRTVLIPKHFKLSIPQTRINRIFSELQKLNAHFYVNSCAVVFRVFVELSVDEYAQRHKISLKVFPKPKKGAQTPPKPKDMALREKLKTVSEEMAAKGICTKDELRGVRTLVSKQYHVLSIDTLNAYVHNKDYNPTDTDLKQTWDNIQVFIERLWTP